METSLWLQPQLNAIVFENRNKEYGAFVLRSHYHRTMSRSIMVSIVLFILGFLGFRFYLEYVSSHSFFDKIIEDETVILLQPRYQVEKPKLKPIPKASVPAIQSHQAVVPPRVVIDELVNEPVTPPSEPTFQPSVIGTGNDTTTMENPEDVVTGGGNGDNIENVDDVISAPVPIYLVDQQPEFPGGMDAMKKYLRDNLSFPEMAKEVNVSGTVVMQFMVSATGEIESVTILKTPSALFNRTSMEAIKGMPNWKPGIYHGKPVPVIFTLPLKFELL